MYEAYYIILFMDILYCPDNNQLLYYNKHIRSHISRRVYLNECSVYKSFNDSFDNCAPLMRCALRALYLQIVVGANFFRQSVRVSLRSSSTVVNQLQAD